MSLAIINSPNREEIENDLNNTIFNCVQPKPVARIIWNEVEALISGGASEEFVYNYVEECIGK